MPPIDTPPKTQNSRGRQLLDLALNKLKPNDRKLSFKKAKKKGGCCANIFMQFL